MSHLPRRRAVSSGLGAALLLAFALPATAGPSVTTATGSNPWVSQVASPTGIDYAGWLPVIRQKGRDRVAAPAYAAARTAVGLTTAPALTTTAAEAPTVLKGFGTGADQNPRARVTALAAGALKVPTVDGDLLSVSLTGPGSFAITTARLQQTPGTGVNLSGLYPVGSPVSGTGASQAVAVDTDRGIPSVVLTGVTAASVLDVEVLRPAAESQAKAARVVIDVDGATVDTTKWGGTGVSTLSPLATFLPAWGLKASQKGAVVKAMLTTVKAALVTPGRRVTVSTTLSGNDPFGQPGVSRVVLGGTAAESGVAAISASVGIDPGNFAREDDSLVQLDALSAEPNPDAARLDDPSLNAYLTADSDRVAFIGRALGELVLHEIGHQAGLFDTDDTDNNRSTMDAGGHRIADNLYLVGTDGVGGTADDPSAAGLLGLANLQPLEGLRPTGADAFQESSEILDWAFAPKPVA